MPLYEYKCNECETLFEEIRIIDKRNETKPCPKCEAGELALQISAPKITFIGRGFHAVDYGNPLAKAATQHPDAEPTKLTKTV